MTSGELVSFWTSDDVRLDGFVVDRRSARHGGGMKSATILYLHGKGGNFYSGPGRFMTELCADERLVHFAVNMRCHDLGYTTPEAERPASGGPSARGGMWEHTADGALDIAAALAFAKGWETDLTVLVGHSSGGFYAPLYLAEHTDSSLSALVLLSPLMSGRTPFPRWFPTEEEEREALGTARQAVARGEGHRVIALPEWYYAISAESLLERADEPDHLWRDALMRVTVPVLVLWGDRESRGPVWDSVCKEHPGEVAGQIERVAVHGAEHEYSGHEGLVCDAITHFVGQLLDGRPLGS